MRKLNKIGVAVVGTTVAVAGAGVAYAAWSASGTGSGAATSRSAQSLVVTAGTTTGDLYPSTSSNTGKLSLSIKNPNPYAVTVTALSADSSGVPSNASCNVDAIYAGESGLTITVLAGDTVTYTSPGNTVNLPFAANNSCQGNTFTFSAITASGGQAATP